MDAMLARVKAFLGTSVGRWIVKAAIVCIGALTSSGMIPLDMPIAFGFSLGQLLIGAGILTPTGQMNVPPGPVCPACAALATAERGEPPA